METLLWYLEVIWDYVAQMLPCALTAGAVFLALCPWRRRRLAAQGLKSGPWREGALFLFVMFCAGLGALTLFQANFWSWQHWYWVFNGDEPLFRPVDYAKQIEAMQLIPFCHILAGGGSSRWGFLMFLGNVFIFSPIGFFPALVGVKPRWWKALLTGFLCSLTVEIVQFFIGRATDINDVLLNTLGAVVGFWFFLLLRKVAPNLVKLFQYTQLEEQDGRETGDTAASA